MAKMSSAMTPANQNKERGAEAALREHFHLRVCVCVCERERERE
jgi:hypothetical protein